MNSVFNNKLANIKSSQVKSKFSIMLKLVLSSLFLVYFSIANAALPDGLVTTPNLVGGYGHTLYLASVKKLGYFDEGEEKNQESRDIQTTAG